MFASAATASGSIPGTDHSSARRLNNSKLICEISAKQRLVALRHLHVRLRTPPAPPRHVDRAAAPIRIHRQIRVRAVQTRHAGTGSPRSNTADPPTTARPATSAPARTIQPPSRRRRANNWRTLNSLTCEEDISLYVIR